MLTSQVEIAESYNCQQSHEEMYDLITMQATRQTADEYLARLDQLYKGKTPQDPAIRIMIDLSSSGMPPLSYMLPKIREFIMNHPYRPPTRNAYLLNEMSYAHSLDTVVNM